jgi:chromosomal replication initiation ATPase DnaA
MTPREQNLAEVAEIAKDYGYTIHDILGPRRNKALVAVRVECIKTFRDRGLSTPQIGRIMNRDHTTICHALNKDVK